MQHPSAALDDALEQKAAYIEGGATPETSSLGVQQSLLSPEACSCHLRSMETLEICCIH